MQGLSLPLSLRRLLAWAYLVLAMLAPLMLLVAPGQLPLSVDQSLLRVENGLFINPPALLAEGADNYTVNVVSALEGNIASAAANYPDGSNAMVALFETTDATTAALEKLVGMIPHQQEKTDLWARHFASDSGEYVMLAHVDTVLLMIISEREELARDRLASLPVLNYNPSPGLGALLQQQSMLFELSLMSFYVMVQWLFVRLIFVWASANRSAPDHLPGKQEQESDG